MTNGRIRQLRNWCDGRLIAGHLLNEALDAIVELKKDVEALNKALIKAKKGEK